MESIAKLKWRCRRGTLEMDLLLENYLEKHYLSANMQEQAQFLQLLALEDPQLQAYLIEGRCPPGHQLYALVMRLRQNFNLDRITS